MKLKDENGAIIIEAVISLSVFMFFVVSLLSIINICYVQAKMGTALNEAAKELSQYSYMYAISSMNQKQAEIYEGSAQARDAVDSSIEGLGGMYDALQSMKGDASGMNAGNVSQSLEKINQDFEKGKASEQELENVFRSIADDPKAFTISMGKLIGNGVIEKGKSEILAPILARILLKKHLKTNTTQDTEAFLKGMRIVPDASGSYFGGIRFSDSVLYQNGSQSIKLVARYKVKVINLLPINMEIKFCQSAETDGWGGL